MRRIEWNPNHKSADEQQNEFIDEYLTWSAEKRWNYLMDLISMGLPKRKTKKGKRRIEWVESDVV
jgi:hypothetical protein